MHHQTKKSAVAKYSPLVEGKSKEEAISIILSDEKNFTADDAEEIYNAITGGVYDAGPSEPTTEALAAMPAPNVGNYVGANNGYIICNEWRGRFNEGVFKPLEIVRKNVKLTVDNLEQLNMSCNPHNPVKYIPVNE